MPIYSHSRLECFENCPLQYKFAYVDNIKRQKEGIEAFLGSRFHETMEKLYKDLKCKVYSLEEVLEYYESRWDKEWNDNIVITKKDRIAQDYRNIGRKCIEDYYKRYSPFNQSRILGLEREVMMDLKGDGKYKLRGFIDRITQTDDNTYEIHDYKTAGYLPEQRYFDENRQLALYQIGIKNIWNDVESVKLVWHYVVFDKEMTSSRTEEQLEKLRQNIIILVQQIENIKEFIPCESNLCEWCVYPDLCPKRKHLYRVEALPVNESLKDDGVKLTNTFAKLVTQKREYQDKIKIVDEEIDKVKEAVVKYGEKEGVDIIRGSDNKLKITEKQKVSSPSKGSPERKELEDIVRQVNKWDEVSELDTFAIEKVVNEERWDKKIIEKIKKYLTIETKKSVSLSKLQDKEK